MKWGKFQVLSRRQALFALAALFLAAALLVVLVTAIPSALTAATMSAGKKMPICCTDRSQMVVSLTFDVAQGDESVEQLQQILAKYRVSATFFVTGAWAERYPDSIRTLISAGQEIMSASDDSTRLTGLPRNKIMTRINLGGDRIQAVTGVRPMCFRASDGDYDNALLETVDALGMSSIRWDVDSFDGVGLPADGIIKRVVSQTSSGSILRFQSNGEYTVEALPSVIEQLQAKGYAFLPISAMIYTDHYVINRQGRQISMSNTSR